MRRPLLLFAFLGTLIIHGCRCDDLNGDNGQLEFYVPSNVVTGAEHRAILPPEYRFGDPPGPVTDYKFAFDGTSLDTSGTSGIRVLETTRDGDGNWIVHFVCSEQPSGARLHVKVIKDGVTKYEDGTSFACITPDLVRTDLTEDPPFVTRARVNVSVDPFKNDGTRFVSIDAAFLKLPAGSPFQVPDDAVVPPEGLRTHQPLTFIATAPTSNLEVRSGSWIATLPVEIVPDSAWEPRIEVSSSTESGNSTVWSLRAVAGLPDGGVANGLRDCAIVEDGAPLSRQEAEDCRFGATADPSTHVCVTVRSKTTCADFGRADGGS